MSVSGVVLVAGEGTRLRPLTYTLPKPLIPIMGRPLVTRIIEELMGNGINNIHVVVGHLGFLFKQVLGDGSGLGVNIRYVEQRERLGIAHAIHRAVEDGAVGELVVHLGDNYFGEGLGRFIREFREGDYDVYVVLTRHRDPTRFGNAVIKDGRIVKLIEKPREPPPNSFVMTGIYMFRDSHDVERAFSTLKPSARGEYEITDLIQWFIDNGRRVGYSITNSWWKDMGTPQDILDLLYLMLDEVKPRIEGEVRGEVNGRVVVERGAVIEGRVHGPAYIGKGSMVGKDTVIEHYVDIESNVSINGGSLSRSLVLSDASLELGRARLVDSIIGPKSRVRLSGGNYSLILGEGNSIISIA
ncbi:glucose-1-phosphate thymidylyltransferase [Vulcanisaeta distributa]|uniref:Glucose-1-phosphate thymidyltransferase n=1 Tax=Vulcanisaeta distributa (strain DSM 14429 / JCM 11212 / NBRC 100878 / IC-017) TaxID=572478 RepID=E1QTC5_VULDI|nr:glucose-1-phosphate thymidylyltransferase [Vulcanisaeta distributa]ADN50918.1 glucose-1-phosphate thymidyltransferase [Vulcanisaeta distributa DSM 14429]